MTLYSNDMKSASNKCISSYKQITYEMEKITDVVIRLIESKNDKNSDLKTLKTFKDKLEDLKKYSMSELTSENFIIDIKDVFGKISASLRDFRSNVIITAKKNGITQIDKIANKLPGMLINLFENFNSYLKGISKEVNSVTNDIEEKKKKIDDFSKKIKDNKEPLNESFWDSLWDDAVNAISKAWNIYEKINRNQIALLNAQTKYATATGLQNKTYQSQFHGKAIEGFAQGLTNTFSKIFGAFSLGNDKIKSACTSLEQSIKDLKTAAANDSASDFLSDSRFTNVLGGIAAIAGTYYLIKKAYEAIKRKLSA